MPEVAHRRHETVRERRHVPHARALRRARHLARLPVVHRDRLFAEHMLACRDGRMGDGCVSEIRCGDDHRMNVVALHDVLVVRGADGHARLLPRGFERRGICVAQRGDFDIPAHRESGEMILQRDAAGADDCEIECAHGPRRTAERSGGGKPVAALVKAQADRPCVQSARAFTCAATSGRRNGAVRLTGCAATSSGVPLATTSPPAAPASGPMSTT